MPMPWLALGVIAASACDRHRADAASRLPRARPDDFRIERFVGTPRVFVDTRCAQMVCTITRHRDAVEAEYSMPLAPADFDAIYRAVRDAAFDRVVSDETPLPIGAPTRVLVRAAGASYEVSTGGGVQVRDAWLAEFFSVLRTLDWVIDRAERAESVPMRLDLDSHWLAVPVVLAIDGRQLGASSPLGEGDRVRTTSLVPGTHLVAVSVGDVAAPRLRATLAVDFEPGRAVHLAERDGRVVSE